MSFDLGAFLDVLDGAPREEVEKGLVALECAASFSAFCRAAWSSLEGRPCIWSWHMDAICEALQSVAEGRVRRLVVNVPPRMSKSSLVSVLWPAWLWTRRPELRLLVCSSVESVVFRDAMRHHDLSDSPWYQETFEPEWGWSGSQDAKSYFVQTAGGSRTSKTVGQKLQGVDADVLLVDDPLDTRDASPNRVALREHVEWFDERACSRLTTPEAPIVVIMQRLHESDLTGVLLERGGWDRLILPAIADGERRSTLPDFDRREKGEPLCSRLPASYLDERRRALGERGFAAQMQQRPAPAEGSVFRKDWLKFWDEATLPAAFDFKVASWDTVFRAGRSNDWCVGQVWGVKGANVYLLEQTRARMDLDVTIREIQGQHSRHPGIRATLVEQSGNGLAIVEALKAQVPGLEALSVQGQDKEQRAHATIPRWAAGQVYLPHPHVFPWVDRHFLPELLGFPVSRHDDQVDAMTQALNWISAHPSAMPVIFRL